jgi:hypothetical protein
MKTGSLRTRVTLTTLALLAVVLAAVVAAVTVAYRAKLEGDLRTGLAAAGALVQQAGSAPGTKLLIPGLALKERSTRDPMPHGASFTLSLPPPPSVGQRSP